MKKQQYVYFMRPVGMLGPVKIGCSEAPEARLLSLSTWSPFPLEVAAMVPGNWKLEHMLHQCFADAHSHREWFHPTARLIGAIQALQAGSPIEEAVDLAARDASFRKTKIVFRPGRRLFISYFHRLRHAMERASPANDRLLSPDDFSRILDRWPSWDTCPLTAEESARLEEVIADPARHCRTYSQIFGRPFPAHLLPAPSLPERAAS